VLVLPLVGVLATVTLLVAVVAGALVAVRRAQSAADLAALAGAAAASRGHDACEAARRVAGRNGALLESCEAVGRDVLVRVVSRGPTLMGRTVTVREQARAGPSSPPPS
jgi:secretion/DNA translocation related TadE-like protein